MASLGRSARGAGALLVAREHDGDAHAIELPGLAQGAQQGGGDERGVPRHGQHRTVGGVDGCRDAADRTGTRVMRLWDWSVPPRPLAHREVLSVLPEEDLGRPPLLFVHGVAHGAWCFAEHWLPAAAQRGYPAYAVSLRGHGGSGGAAHLGRALQRDYVHDGWNLTGDAYEMDAEGYFHYRSRTDDMIISAGYNIAGPEVESALLTHPAVAECGVVGIADDDRGQIVQAFVVLKPGHAASSDTVTALQEHVKATIAPFKYPRKVVFLNALPRTETGKLQRFKLRQMS